MLENEYVGFLGEIIVRVMVFLFDDFWFYSRDLEFYRIVGFGFLVKCFVL